MKTLVLSLSFIFIFQIGKTQTIEPAPKDKSIVYFVRLCASPGPIMNFTYYHDDAVIGRFNACNYIRYECQPGQHTFWASAENKDIIEADLEAGKIYVIEAVAYFGSFSAKVNLNPIDPRVHRLRPIQRLLFKKESKYFSPAELRDIRAQKEWARKKGKEIINRKKEKGRYIDQLTADMSITPEQLVFEKKRKKKK